MITRKPILQYEGSSDSYEHWQGIASEKGYAWDRDLCVYVITEGNKVIPHFEIEKGMSIDEVELILVGREHAALDAAIAKEQQLRRLVEVAEETRNELINLLPGTSDEELAAYWEEGDEDNGANS